MENWKQVKNYEGFYEVSDLGRVRRVDSVVNTGIKHNTTKVWKGRILKQHLKRNGYLTVDLSKNYQVKTISVHRLVAIAFVEGYSEDKNYVDHINCNKQDNRACNLEWVSAKENSRRARENNLIHNPNKKKIRCKQLNMVFDSSYQAAEFLNEKYFGNSKKIVSIAGKIRAAANGLQKVAYGFTWEYCI